MVYVNERIVLNDRNLCHQLIAKIEFISLKWSIKTFKKQASKHDKDQENKMT
jgi:hypothetical protein